MNFKCQLYILFFRLPLNHEYKPTYAVTNLNASFNHSEITAVLGHNGNIKKKTEKMIFKKKIKFFSKKVLEKQLYYQC